MKIKFLLRVLMVGFGLLLAVLGSLLYVQHISQAQEPVVTLTKVLNKPGNVVRVGEVLSFTITLVNNAPFTFTKVTLVDDYDEDTLGFAGASVSWGGHDPANGIITWTNVATPPIYPAQGMPPGGTITITVVFTAEHPKPTVVNWVRAQDLISEGGQLSQTLETSRTQEAPPNEVPVFKGIWPPGSTPQVGAPVTFTHIITNDGASILVQLPVTDTYNATFLEFNFAIPTPTTVITGPTVGMIIWDNLAGAGYFGPIPPFGTVVVTTVFTATAQIVDGLVNEALVEGAVDEYGNNWAPGATQVPITIIAADTPTPTPERSNGGDEDEDEETATPAPTPTATAVSLATPTATPVTGQSVISGTQTPLYLPETGGARTVGFTVPIAGLFMFGWAWYVYKSKIKR